MGKKIIDFKTRRHASQVRKSNAGRGGEISKATQCYTALQSIHLLTLNYASYLMGRRKGAWSVAISLWSEFRQRTNSLKDIFCLFGLRYGHITSAITTVSPLKENIQAGVYKVESAPPPPGFGDREEGQKLEKKKKEKIWRFYTFSSTKR